MSVGGRLQHWREEPLARVAAEARLLRPRRRRQFGAFGEGSIVHRPMWLYGTRHATVGSHVLIMHAVWLSVERTAWEQEAPALVIGDRVSFRPHVAVSASTSVVIEDAVTFGMGVGVYDSNHLVGQGRVSVLDTPLERSPVRIGTGSWLGDRVTVLGGARIGANCVIGAGSVVRGEIPDNSVAVGVPARVVSEREAT